jgi:hypothetical protein
MEGISGAKKGMVVMILLLLLVAVQAVDHPTAFFHFHLPFGRKTGSLRSQVQCKVCVETKDRSYSLCRLLRSMHDRMQIFTIF